MSEEEIARNLQTEMVALREELAALRMARVSQPTSRTARTAKNGQVDSSKTQSTDPVQQAANPWTAEQTLAYWKRLCAIALDEAALQVDAQKTFTDDTADRVFALRGRVSRFAAKAVEAIPSTGVDPEAIRLGSQLADWYLRGGQHYDRGAALWSDQSAQQSSAKFLKNWSTAKRQLDNEAELLNNKATAVQASLSRRYRTNFPTFGS